MGDGSGFLFIFDELNMLGVIPDWSDTRGTYNTILFAKCLVYHNDFRAVIR